MRITVLGGVGAVGSTAVKVLAMSDVFSEIVIGDTEIEKAKKLASELDTRKVSADNNSNAMGQVQFSRRNSVSEPSYRMAQIYQAPFLHFRKTWILPGGGMYPGLVPVTVEEFGIDVTIGGGTVAGYPMGAEAAATALRQAVDATMNDIPLEEYAKDKPELRAVIEAWGVFKAPKEILFRGAKTS